MFFARLQRNFPISQIVTILAFCMMAMSARADIVKPDPLDCANGGCRHSTQGPAIQ